MAKRWVVKLPVGYGYLPVLTEVMPNECVTDEITRLMGNEPDSDSCWSSYELPSGYVLVVHNQANPQVRDGEKAKIQTLNPMATGLSGSEICGVAVICRLDGHGSPAPIGDDDANGVMPVLSGLFDKYCRVEPESYRAPRLCFVEEINPGRGFAYFSDGCIVHNDYVGWDLAPAFQYAEPPFTTNETRIVAVVYDCAALALPDDVRMWNGWSANAINSGKSHWLETRDRREKLGHDCTLEAFVKVVRDNGGVVYIQEAAGKDEETEETGKTEQTEGIE